MPRAPAQRPDLVTQALVLLDGSRSLADLVVEAELAFGQMGPVRLARLLADLGDRGMLAVIESSTTRDAPAPDGRMRRLLKIRERTIDGVGPFFGWAYRHGGWTCSRGRPCS